MLYSRVLGCRHHFGDGTAYRATFRNRIMMMDDLKSQAISSVVGHKQSQLAQTLSPISPNELLGADSRRSYTYSFVRDCVPALLGTVTPDDKGAFVSTKSRHQNTLHASHVRL